MDKQIVVVTGANRGIGFTLCHQLAKKGYKVILTARNEKEGNEACMSLKEKGCEDIIFFKLDVTSRVNCKALGDALKDRYGKIDLLINNAGIMLDHPTRGVDVDPKIIQDTLSVNLYGVINVTQELIPLIKGSKKGRIVNISSGLGQLTNMAGGATGYRLSKVSLNALTRIWAHELESDHIMVISVCPGWCQTDMGGKEAERTSSEGAESIIRIAESNNVQSGFFYRDGIEIPW